MQKPHVGEVGDKWQGDGLWTHVVRASLDGDQMGGT